MGLLGLAEEPPFGQTENGLASIKRHVSAKFPIKNNADDDDEDNNDNNNRKRRSLSFSSEVHFIAEYTGNLKGEHCLGFSTIF